MEYGFLSVLPPVLTIVLAIMTKNVFVSLFTGIVLGNLVLTGGNPIIALDKSFNGVVKTFSSSGNTIVIASILMIGALIYLIEKSGGITGFVDFMVKKRGLIKSKRAANIFTWLIGVFVFTSGSLSCMVTGSVARPINDAMKVPHEKAAFLVHSTSTPVCVLLPLSGWGASMIGYLTSGGIPEAEAGAILVSSIALNFYCILAVGGCLVLAILDKDFGPMKEAELRAAATGALDREESGEKALAADELAGVVPRAMNLFIPMGTLIATILGVLFVTGEGDMLKGHGMNALLWGVSVALIVMCLMCVLEGIYTTNQVISEAFKGAGGMLSIAMILAFGFAMGTLVKALGTGNYLSHVFAQTLSPGLLPVLVFLLACVLSFATGTSMGTMAITSVIALPMAMNLGVSLPLVASAIWGGSIFGDHASPISDTTIMSCATTGCDIIDHVKTQAPYVLGFAGVTVVLYLIAGFIL